MTSPYSCRVPRWSWRYRYSASGEREQKRLYPLDTNDHLTSHGNPWAYSGSANKTNTRVNAAAEIAGTAGKALLVVGVASSAYNVATSTNVPRTIVSETGAWAGALAGGAIGAEMGAVIGSIVPAAGTLVGAVVGGVVGGAVGAVAGTTIAEHTYDEVASP